jgi:hypothetical protein
VARSVTATVTGEEVTLARAGLEDVVGTVTADAPLTGAVLGPDVDACTGLRFGGGDPIPTSTLEFRTPPRRTTELVSRFVLP